ncbi:MAG: aminotransferase class V-fold PLP-dependent enzyme [Acidobacteria bacterium]|nr:aminotransferase class V-fold PLP-dependent enzyme [Acidobacteriota bacterium]
MNKKELRYLFPVTRNCIYLNHAAVGPLARHSYEAMEELARDQRDWGAVHWRSWLGHYKRFRENAARLIGATPGEIAILKNTSEGISFVAEGLDWKAGENVVTTDMEFPSNFVPWKRLERRGVECRQIANRDGRFDVADVEAIIDGKTRVVALSAVSYHNGFRPDLEEIGALCASRGILFSLDAIQSLGAIAIDVKRCHISFLASDGHKWLLGPEGLAIFFASEEARERLTPLESGWMSLARDATSLGKVTELHRDARRFEAGSINTAGVCGLDASIAFLNGIGIGEIEAEVLRLARSLGDALTAIGFTLRTPAPASSGIVSLTPPVEIDLVSVRRALRPGSAGDATGDIPPVQLLHAWLELHGVICSAREGMLRFSPHFYNDDAEIGRVAELLGSLV